MPSSNNTRNDSTYGHHQMVTTKTRLIIFFAAKDGEALYSQQNTRPGADCDSDYELLIVKFRLRLKKIGKATRPFRYAKSLQSRPTLCNPIDGSPLGSPIPRVLQARTLEWVAIACSNA